MYRSIQICRAVAACLVMMLHLCGAVAAAKYFGLTGFDVPFHFGRAGVEFFFVLSGFIITYVHWSDFGKPARLSNFLRKRLVRIYPTYWIIFAGVYVVALATIGRTMWLDAPTLAKTLALLPQVSSDIEIGTQAPVLIVAWSLQYEILFYLLMSVFIVSRPIGALFAILILGNLVACRSGHCVAPQPYLHTSFILLFALGAAAAFVCKAKIDVKYPLVLAVLGALAFLAFGIWDDVSGERWTFGFGLASTLIVIGLVRAEDGGLEVSEGWPTRLGDASYVLYLIQYPIISVVCKLVVFSGLNGWIGAAIAIPTAILACIFFSLAFHARVERPLIKALSGFSARAVARPADAPSQ